MTLPTGLVAGSGTVIAAFELSAAQVRPCRRLIRTGPATPRHPTRRQPIVTVQVIASVSEAPLLIAVNVALASIVPSRRR